MLYEKSVPLTRTLEEDFDAYDTDDDDKAGEELNVQVDGNVFFGSDTSVDEYDEDDGFLVGDDEEVEEEYSDEEKEKTRGELDTDSSMDEADGHIDSDDENANEGHAIHEEFLSEDDEVSLADEADVGVARKKSRFIVSDSEEEVDL